MENSKILRKNSHFVHIKFKQNIDLLKYDHYLKTVIRKKRLIYIMFYVFIDFYDIQDRHLRPLLNFPAFILSSLSWQEAKDFCQ